jgi:hypothetical protein
MSENAFKINYITEEDVKIQTLELVKNIKEEAKSEFEFNSEPFYYVGRGHNFAYGFYNEYITKSGIRATQFSSGLWHIGNEEYKYDNGWVLVERQPYTPMDFNELTLPIVKNVNTKTISGDIISVKPKNGNGN